MIIDGTNLIVGRASAFIAKRALEGERMDLINCERMIITGDKKLIVKKYNEINNKTDPYHGPFLERMPDRFVKRIIRGMLPYKQERGREALKRVRCHIGIPSVLRDKKAEVIAFADIARIKTLKYITVGELSSLLGKKWQ